MAKEKNIKELVPNKKYRIDIERGRKNDGSRNRIVKIVDGTLKQAIEERDKLLYEVKYQVIKPDSNMKFIDFAKLWLKDYAEENTKETTYLGYKSNLNAHIIPYFKDYKLSEITVYEIERFYNYLKKKKINNSDKGSNEKYLSSNTIVHQHRQLSLMFNTAVKWEFITSNPCLKLIKPPTTIKQDMDFYSKEEVGIVLKHLEEEDINFKLAIYMLIFRGLRRGELLGLHWDDINFDEQTIYIHRNLLDIRGKGIKETTPKTKNSIRTIPMTPSIYKLLLEQKESLNSKKKIFGKQWVDSPYVITGVYGNHLGPERLSEHWKRFVKGIGLRKIRLHDLRHTCATLLFNEGVPAGTVSKLLGHSNIYVTLTLYAHPVNEEDKKAAYVLDNLLLKEKC